MNDDTAGRTAGEEALVAEIEHTRQRLGETVEALAAKTDVKARAKHRAAEITGAVRNVTPDPVWRSTGEAVVIMRSRRGKVAAASLAALAVALAWVAVRRQRR